MTDISRDELLSIINQCIFFSAVPEQEILKLENYFEKITLPVGEILFRQGDRPWDIFILTQGKLIGLLESRNSVQVINTMIPIETIGELGVISGEPRSLTIKAVANSELLKLPGEHFIELCQKNPQISLEIMRLISHRSIKTIKLISNGNLHKFIVIFPANESIPLESFVDNIRKHMDSFYIKYLISDQEQAVKIVKNIGHNQNSNEFLVIILKKYDSKLFKLLEENQSHFFLLGQGDDVELDPSAVSIIRYIQQFNHAINEPAFHFLLELILLQKNDIIKPANTKLWLEKANFHLHHHVRENFENDFQRLMRFATGKAIGLVLGGGGMRAFAHLGVIKALLENNIPIDILGGTSSGACVAAHYNITRDCSPTHEIISRVTGALRQSLSLKNLTWISTSIFNGDPCTSMLKEIFNSILIEDLWLPFFCISANLSTLTNSETIHRSNLVWEALRSSSAIPGLLPPMVLNGELHLDGALINNLPVDTMRTILGPNGKIIASQLSHIVKNKTTYNFPPVVPFPDVFFHKIGLAHKSYKFPNFFEIFFDSLLLSANFREEQNSTKADLLVRPNFSGFGMYKITKKQELQLFEIGYLETLRALQEYNFSILR